MRVLVVDDDVAALEIRKLVIARRGVAHGARGINAGLAREMFAAGCEAVVLDLRLPAVEDGLALIREFRGARLVVLCGNRGDIDGRPEARMVAAILEKPVRSEVVLQAIEGR